MRFVRFGSKGSIRSMSSKGWGFRKVGTAFSYFLFLVSYFLFLCALAPLRETKNVQKVGNFGMPVYTSLLM
jgi:hypothetical protein